MSTKKSKVDIREKVKTFEDALAIVEKTNPDIRAEYGSLCAIKTIFINRFIAEFKLFIIIQALNEGWTPDWSDINKWKYYPWFFVGGTANDGAIAGFGDVGSIIGASVTTTSIGSRLCYSNRALAEYGGKTFIKEYYEMFKG
jgi:hypothetical protein